MALETELKLRLSPADAEAFAQHPLLQAVEANRTRQHLLATYYDTPRQELLQAGVGLRVRKELGRWIQTVKTAGQAVGSLHQRQEWAREIASNRLELDRLPKEVLRRGIGKKLLARVEPLFTTDFMRTQWIIRHADGSEIEVCLDLGEIRNGAASVELHEIELELKAGNTAALYEVAMEFLEHIPLFIANDSKAARGYALYQARPLAFYKARDPALEKAETAEQAFGEIVWSCLRHLQSNEDMALRGSDSEGVHQMRVALRRLRAAFKLYRDWIGDVAGLREELHWLAGLLGPARDWDVYAEHLAELQSHAGDKEAAMLQDLRGQVGQHQAQSNNAVRAALQSPRYTRLLLQLGHWLTRQGWRDGADKNILQRWQRPVKRHAAKMLDKYDQRLRQWGEDLSQYPLAELHHLRIASKVLAYGARFFISLYPGAAENYLAALSDVRDELGELNDTVVAQRLLEQLKVAPNAPIRWFLRGWNLARLEEKLRCAPRAWSVFLAQPPFWR